MHPRTRLTSLALAALLPIAALAGCGSDDAEDRADTTAPTEEATSVVLYTGRDEALIGPLIDQFSQETGIEVEVRYGDSAEMGAQLLEEGDRTPADVFLSQDAGAIGVLASAGLLADLPDETLDLVGSPYRPAEGNAWVAVTGRSRVIVYNPDLVDDVPESVLDLTDPQYEGQVAWAPGNASFQSFVTGLRVSAGEDAAKTWLEDMIANGAQSYEKNGEILDAVNQGDIAIGLINHYYWARSQPELGDDLVAKLVFPANGDPGGLVNVTAVGITKPGESNPAAQALVDYLMSEAGQTYFVEKTFEYPMISGVGQPEGVPSLDELDTPDIDLTDLESLEATQALLADVGLLS
jgi:iron(III) transport system substrate-binding protein